MLHAQRQRLSMPAIQAHWGQISQVFALFIFYDKLKSGLTFENFYQWRSMRSGRVSMPVIVRNALNGAIVGPRSRRPTAWPMCTHVCSCMYEPKKCMHVYLYKYTHIHRSKTVYKYVNIYLFVIVCIYIHIYACIYIYVYVYVYVHVYVYIHIYVYICTCIYMDMYRYI